MILPDTTDLPPSVVLDTNALLDWLVFGDAGMAALAKAIEEGAVQWLACSRMRDEFSRTLSYPSLTRWNPDRERALTFFDRCALMHVDPPRTAVGSLVCSDPDDQIFIDLAVGTQARWLVTHDRALLKLRRPAAVAGVTVLQPALWQP